MTGPFGPSQTGKIRPRKGLCAGYRPRQRGCASGPDQRRERPVRLAGHIEGSCDGAELPRRERDHIGDAHAQRLGAHGGRAPAALPRRQSPHSPSWMPCARPRPSCSRRVWGSARGASYLNVNRDAIDPETRKWTQYSNLDAPSDKTVAVLTFDKPTGEPIAVYVNYAMHPINGYVLGIVSGDFPRRHVPLRREGVWRQCHRRFLTGQLRRPEPALSAALQQRDGQPSGEQDHGLRDQPRGVRRPSARCRRTKDRLPRPPIPR